MHSTASFSNLEDPPGKSLVASSLLALNFLRATNLGLALTSFHKNLANKLSSSRCLEVWVSWEASTSLAPTLPLVGVVTIWTKRQYMLEYCATASNSTRWAFLESNVENVMWNLKDGLDMKTVCIQFRSFASLG